MNKYLILFLFLISLFACKENQNGDFLSFPIVYSLEGVIENEEVIISQGILDIYDSLLVITSTPRNTKCIHYFNKNTLKHISSTGIVGQGPNEIKVPAHSCIDKKNGIIWYRDFGRGCLWKFDILKSLNNEHYLPEAYIPLPKNFFIYFGVHNDSLFSFSNTEQNKIISFFNHSGEIVDSLTIPNTINFYDKEISERTRIGTATYLYGKDSKTNDYIIAYRYADVIVKYDINKQEITHQIRSNNFINLPDKEDPSQIVTNECLKIDSSYIYCLYSGLPKFDMNLDDPDYNFSRELNIFDKNLNPVSKLKLSYSAAWFEVDINNRRIITFSPETGSFVTYLIPEKLLNKFT